MLINQKKDISNVRHDYQLVTNLKKSDVTGEQDLSNCNKKIKKFKLKFIIEKSFFQKLLFLSLYRLIVYINKIYQDVNTVDEYWKKQDIYFFIISITSLVAPPITYSIYLISSKLIKNDFINLNLLGTDIFQGLLLFCWQIKRHLDIILFSTQNICNFRSASEDEKNGVFIMKRNSNILEFFENFYAGFLQILLQLYIWLEAIDLSVHPKINKPFISEFFASILCVISFMIMCRRKDDGYLTGFLSFVGWFSLMTSRVLVLSLTAVFIHYWLFLFILIHIILFSIWIFDIAIKSYIVSSSSDEIVTVKFDDVRKRWSLILTIFIFFGIPSIIFWPIMFQLKEHKRPIIYLIIFTLENLTLLLFWFYFQHHVDRVIHVQIVVIITVSTLIGVFFISLYILFKPKYTDQIILYELRESQDILCKSNNSIYYGIYYEFFDIVFKLPSTNKISQKLEIIRELNP